MTTAAERRHMGRVAQLSCGLCGAHGVELHHIRAGQGAAQRASNFLVVPVCPSCHRGPQGIHGDKTMLKIKKWTELDLLADTLARLAADGPWGPNGPRGFCPGEDNYGLAA